MLKDIFGLAEHQQKGTYGLDYRLILRRDNDSAVLNKGNATNNAKTKIISIDWYVPKSIPSLSEENILLHQIVIKETYRASICRKKCFHGRSEYSKFMDF